MDEINEVPCFKRRKLYLELPILLIFFAMTLSESITTNLIIYRTCYVTLGYNETDCALLGLDYSDDRIKELEAEVQPHAITLQSTNLIIQAVVPTFICCFIGPWSDKYGRKPALLYITISLMMSHGIMVILTAFSNSSPWFILLHQIPQSLTGGVTALLTITFAYLTDTIIEQSRAIRIALIAGMRVGGSVIGVSVSVILFKASGYVVVYAVTSVLALLAFIYIFILVPESIIDPETESKFRNFFNISYVEETFKTIIKKRQNYDRALLIITVLVTTIYVLAIFGNSNVIYLYLRKEFGWTLEKCNNYNVTMSLTAIIGGVIGVYFLHSLLHIKEFYVVQLGLIALLCGSLILGFEAHSWQIYVGGSIQSLSAAIDPMARSLLSKLVPREEVSKVFAIVTSLEMLAAVGGGLLFLSIYNNTIRTFPSAVFFVTAGMYCYGLILVIVLMYLQFRKTPKVPYEVTVNCTIENSSS